MGERPELSLSNGALELLFERADLPAFDLPAELGRVYSGVFGIRRPSLFANFVSSVDGAVALESPGESGHVISANSEADHFVMGLLRASADAVVIGAGTLRASPKHLWTVERIFPAAAERFADFRRSQGLAETPRLVVVTASGELDGSSPALHDATVATTAAGKARLSGRLPPSTRVVAFDEGPTSVSLAAVLELLHGEGSELVLTEGGPTLVAKLVAEDLLDELFLTVSPRLFGRFLGDGRKAVVDGLDLGGRSLELASARRSGSHLFLRYSIG